MVHEQDAGAAPRDHGHGHHSFEPEALASLLELEAEVLAGFVETGAAIVADACERRGVTVGRVIDLGSGPGVGTMGLASRFDAASIVTIDASDAMLARARQRAGGPRVETRRVDLDGDLRALGRADVVWASMSLHHVRDEVATLRQVAQLLAPRGLLAVLERGGPMSIRLVDELGRPGVWDRLDRAWDRWHADNLANLPGGVNADRYPAMLAAAGFEVLLEEPMVVRVGPAFDASAASFAAHHLRRSSELLASYLDDADRDAVAGLEGDRSERWRAAELRADRRLFVATPY